MQETVSLETVSFFVFCPDFCPPRAGGNRGCRCKKVLYTLYFLLYNIRRANRMEKRKIDALEAALGRCEIHRHRGHVESDRNSFSKNWAEK